MENISMWDCDACDAHWVDEFGSNICSVEGMDIKEMSYCPEEDEEWCYECDNSIDDCDCEFCEECGCYIEDCFCEICEKCGWITSDCQCE